MSDNPTPIPELKRAHQDDEGISAPPRILLWGVIGLFVLFIAGGLAGLYIFTNVLSGGQQERVVNMFPFMEAFVPVRPTPEGGRVPTAEPQAGGIDADELLTIPPIGIPAVGTPAEDTAEPDATAEAAPDMTAEPTPISAAPTLTPTPVPATHTPVPPSPAPTTAAAAAVSTRRFPVSSQLGGLRYIPQTWNNCGPANVTMALSYYGWTDDQDVAGDYLRPNDRDKNVTPFEIADFVNERTGVQAMVRYGGNLDIVRELIAAGFPVIMETGLMPEAYEWIGHYRTIVGYDDAQRIFYIYDSFLGVGTGTGYIETYDEIDRHWQAFNRVFVVIYTEQDAPTVNAILGDHADAQRAAEIAFNVAQDEARANPQNGFAWFNMGTSLVALGRYDEAARAYDRAWQIGVPWRMLWYQFGPFEAYYNVGRYADVLSYVNVNLTNGGDEIEETYFWQGRAYEAMGETGRAISAYRQALQRNTRFIAARDAIDRLS